MTTDDLIERVRATARRKRLAMGMLRDEAADEIEWLRADVAMYEQLLYDESTAYRMMKEAEAERDAAAAGLACC